MESGAVPAPRAVPHCPQNLAVGGFSDAQLGQRRASEAPHPVQNFISFGFSRPQLIQRIAAPPSWYSSQASRGFSKLRPRDAGAGGSRSHWRAIEWRYSIRIRVLSTDRLLWIVHSVYIATLG